MATRLTSAFEAHGFGLLCSACRYLLVQPRQTECGHRYCKTCLEKLFNDSDPAMCYVCQEVISSSQVYPDKAAENDVFRTEIHCPAAAHGCQWKGILGHYLHSHKMQCEYLEQSCPNANLGCKFVGPRKDIASHTEGSCEWRKVTCPNCKISLTWSDLQGHLNNCAKQSSIPLHGRQSSTEIELYQESQHCQLPEAQQATMIGDLMSLTLNLQAKVAHEEEVNQKFKQLVMDKLITLTGLVSRNSKQGMSDEMDSKNWHEINRTASHETAVLSQKMEYLEKAVCVLNKELDRYAGTIESLQQKCFEYEQIIKDLQNTNQTNGIQSKSANFPLIGNNGILVWKLENFNACMRSAKSGKKTSFYSSPFSTNPFGYKLCCRIYPNGDGSGKDTHISLFLAVMKGEFDDVLPWPFKQKVTFMLLDQVNGNHVKETFIPDAFSSSFHKPKSQMNVASGSPQFFKHSRLFSPNSPYIKNDTVFIKIIVDRTGLDL